MTARPGGLGRGLGELFQRTDLPAEKAKNSESDPQPAKGTGDGANQKESSATMPDGSYYAELPVTQIVANPRQPRSVFSEEELAELAESIKEVGLLQPIVVRRTGKKRYELVMGERRLRAHEQAGLTTIPAIVRSTDDSSMLTDALLENLHRVQLNPLEEAAAYEQLMTDFGITHAELAERIKKSRPHISNTIRLLKLPPTVQRRVAAGVLSAGHARALLGLTDPVDQEHLAQRIVAEGLSVRATEEIVTLGDGQDRRHKRAPAPRQPDERAEHIAADLAERLDTRVKVMIGRNKGHITIDFADQEDLSRILTLFKG
ncbi:MAG: ParB/RepB/Spo0J family partition protein [Propionibacterium sp.]